MGLKTKFYIYTNRSGIGYVVKSPTVEYRKVAMWGLLVTSGGGEKQEEGISLFLERKLGKTPNMKHRGGARPLTTRRRRRSKKVLLMFK